MFSPFFFFSQAEGQALLAGRLVHIQNVPVEATCVPDSLLGPCTEPSMVQSPGVAVPVLSLNSGAFPMCSSILMAGGHSGHKHNLSCCTSPPCAAQARTGIPTQCPCLSPNPASSLSCPQGKSPWVRGDSSSFPMVLALKENQFLYF